MFSVTCDTYHDLGFHGVVSVQVAEPSICSGVDKLVNAILLLKL